VFGLDDLLTEDDRALRDFVRQFCDEQVAPVIDAYWEAAQFPRELVPKIAGLGLVGGQIHGYDCPGLTSVADGLVAAEFARADGSVRDFVSVQGLAILTIGLLGSEEQKARWLPPLARLETIGAFAMTEPGHGSDVNALETTARREGGAYVLDGAKRWITNGTIANVLVVWARDEHGDVGAFVVEPPVDGFDTRVMLGKTACRAADHAEITLTGVRVPLDSRLVEARTFADASRVLARSRQGVAWEALGHALAAYEIALSHCLERTQFGRPLAGFQLVQERLSRMLMEVTTTQLLCWRVSRLQDEGRTSVALASAAKMHAASAARRVVLQARELLGANGVLIEQKIARHHVDIEAVYTYEGTHDVNALVLGREITGHSAFAR
jgi:glutaryl-CoA dehydrogenase